MVLSERFRASRHLNRCRKVRLARNTRRAGEEISASCPKERCPVEDMAVYTNTEAHACHALNDVLWHCERAHLGHQPAFASRLPPLSTCILTAGLDVEYSKQRREGLPKPALLQLATPDFVIVIPLGVLHKCSLNLGTEPRGSAVMMLQKLMDTAYIEKVGVGIDDDVEALKRFFTTLDLDLPTQGVMDLRHMSAELGFGRPGLKEMGARVLGYTIQKGRHSGDWEHSALTSDQLQYACDDAWLSQKLGLELKSRSIAQTSDTRVGAAKSPTSLPSIASTTAAAALVLHTDNNAAEQAHGGNKRRRPHMFDSDEAARQRKHNKSSAMESTDLPDRFLGTDVDSVPRAPQVGARLLQLALDSIPWIRCLGFHARRPRRRRAASHNDVRQSAMLHAGHSPMNPEGLTRSKPARSHSSHTSYPRSATAPRLGHASVSSVSMTRQLQASSADPKLDLWCGRAGRGSPSGDVPNQGGETAPAGGDDLQRQPQEHDIGPVGDLRVPRRRRSRRSRRGGFRSKRGTFASVGGASVPRQERAQVGGEDSSSPQRPQAHDDDPVREQCVQRPGRNQFAGSRKRRTMPRRTEFPCEGPVPSSGESTTWKQSRR